MWQSFARPTPQNKLKDRAGSCGSLPWRQRSGRLISFHSLSTHLPRTVRAGLRARCRGCSAGTLPLGHMKGHVDDTPKPPRGGAVTGEPGSSRWSHAFHSRVCFLHSCPLSLFSRPRGRSKWRSASFAFCSGQDWPVLWKPRHLGETVLGTHQGTS